MQNNDANVQNEKNIIDNRINSTEKNNNDKNKEDNKSQHNNPKTNLDKYEIIKNAIITYNPESNYKYQNSFLEIAIFKNELAGQESQLSYHLFKNLLNEIYIFKYDEKEKENMKIKEENSIDAEEKEEKNEDNKNSNIQNIYKFICYDNN